MIINLHYIIQTTIIYNLLSKLYSCNSVFIFELGLQCNEQNQTTQCCSRDIRTSIAMEPKI